MKMKRLNIFIGFFLIFDIFILTFLVKCSEKKNSELFKDIPIVTFSSTEMKEIAIPLKRIDTSSGLLENFSWPSIDFEDRGWISREPLEKNLKGFPINSKINFFGIFELCDAKFNLLFAEDNANKNIFWADYYKNLQYVIVRFHLLMVLTRKGMSFFVLILITMKIS